MWCNTTRNGSVATIHAWHKEKKEKENSPSLTLLTLLLFSSILSQFPTTIPNLIYFQFLLPPSGCINVDIKEVWKTLTDRLFPNGQFHLCM